MAAAERLSSIPSNLVKLLMWTILWIALCALLVGGVPGKKKAYNMIVDMNEFITAEDSQFGPKIKGTSIDNMGRVYAFGFQGNNLQLGQLSNTTGKVDQKLFFKWRDNESYLNGIRFYPVPKGTSEVLSAAVVVDKKGQVLQLLQGKDGVVRGRVFCKDKRMIKPNDIAVAFESGRVYSTGYNYPPTTVHGDRDFWLCKMPNDGAIHYSDLGENGTITTAMRLNVQGRASAIEVSNDEKHLYVSQTHVMTTKLYKNVVWKFDIDQWTGHLSNKWLFFLQEMEGRARDIKGMRTDMVGNLYLARNDEVGEVFKVSPKGKIIRSTKLLGVTQPTHIELGGPHGTTLFIVGKCKMDKKKGCIDTWENSDAPGRSFFYLYRPVPRALEPEESSSHEEL